MQGTVFEDRNGFFPVPTVDLSKGLAAALIPCPLVSRIQAHWFSGLVQFRVTLLALEIVLVIVLVIGFSAV